MAYGQAEAQLVVRRTLSLTASLPRIVRVGDAFMVGAWGSCSLGVRTCMHRGP